MTLDDTINTVLSQYPTVKQQREALADLFKQVSGIRQVFTRIPSALQSAQLPALVIVPEEAEFEQAYEGDLTIVRAWTLRLYVMQFQEGREFDPQQACEPFLDRLVVAVTAYPYLTLSDGRAFAVRPVSGSTVQTLTFNDQVYAGISLRIQTQVQSFVPRLQ